jgi:hypothetical protein
MGSTVAPSQEPSTMRNTQVECNPFMMMTDPEVILQAVERSERLSRLQRHVCRPLDRPLIPKVAQADLMAFDAAIDHDDTDADDDLDADTND